MHRPRTTTGRCPRASSTSASTRCSARCARSRRRPVLGPARPSAGQPALRRRRGPKRVRYWALRSRRRRLHRQPRGRRASLAAGQRGVRPAVARPRRRRPRAVRDATPGGPARSSSSGTPRAGAKKGWTGSRRRPPAGPVRPRQRRPGRDLLQAYAVRRLAAADVVRCRDTLAPYARNAGLTITELPATTAGAYEQDPAAGADAVAQLLDGDGSAAWCGQREVIPDLAAALAARLAGRARCRRLGTPRATRAMTSRCAMGASRWLPSARRRAAAVGSSARR